MKAIDRIKTPEQLIWLGLAAWWIVNLLQAGLTELANDEAYYRLFADHLAWGYFDHPPMTALLVWLGGGVGPELGVRLFFTLLQPLYLWALWRMIRPANALVRDAGLFLLIASAIPMLQLYGFLAVPDGPLMLFTALLLWCYKHFSERDDWFSAMGMGVCMAALAYSKYQGALVVILLIGSNWKLLTNPKFYAAGLLALILVAPHLWWQHQNDWVSLRYHLLERNRSFRWGYLFEYLLNLLAVFNPFLFPIFLKAWWKQTSATPVLRAMSCIAAGFFLFFLSSTLRGHVQPQWVIPAAFGVIASIFFYVRTRAGLHRYTVRAAWITLALMALVRIEMAFNPLGIRYQIFDNGASYGAIARAAGGRPVIFDGLYARAAKYALYTGGESFARPSVYSRSSQYELLDTDRAFAGGEALVQVPDTLPGATTLELANGNRFSYIIDTLYRPVREITVTGAEFPATLHPGDTLMLGLTLTNPYPDDYPFAPDQTRIGLVLRSRESRFTQVTPMHSDPLLLAARSTANLTARVVVPSVPPGEYNAGLTLFNSPASTWYNSAVARLTIE